MKSCLDIVLHSHSIVGISMYFTVSLSVIIQRISDNRRANGDWLNGRLASRATGVEEKKMAKWCDPLIVSGRLVFIADIDFSNLIFGFYYRHGY